MEKQRPLKTDEFQVSSNRHSVESPFATLPTRGVLVNRRMHGGIICVSVALLALLWTAVGLYLQYDRAQAIGRASVDTTNLSRTIEERLNGILRIVDQTLLIIKRDYEKNPSGFHVASEFRDIPLPPDLLIQMGIIGADGFVIASNLGPITSPVYLGDRAHFRAHAGVDTGVMMIGPPVLGRISQRWSIQMTRRLNRPDGSFGGVVVVSFDPDYLQDFFHGLGLGKHGAAVVMGLDMIIRAGINFSQKPGGTIGRSLANWPIVSALARAPAGTFEAVSEPDNIDRIFSYHTLQHYQLVTIAGQAREDVLASFHQRQIWLISAAGCLSALGLAVAMLLFKRVDAQRRTEAALRENELRLQAFAEMSSDWFWEQGADLRFTRQANIPHTTLPTDVGQARWEFADSAMDPQRWEPHKADLAARRSFRNFRWERIRKDGERRYLSTSGDPIFDEAGVFLGYHGTGRDVTMEVAARDRAEQAETLLRDAVDSMTAAFVIYDRDERFVMCNELYLQRHTNTPGESTDLLPGARLKDILLLQAVNGGDSQARGREDAWVADQLKFHREASGSIEQRLDNGLWFLITNRRMKNGGITGLRIDITSQKQAEKALAESEARLDRAQAIAGIGSWELEPATRRYIWSKEMYRIRGFVPTEFDPTIDNIASYVHIDDRVPMQHWLDELIKTGTASTQEMRVMRQAGDIRLVRVEGQAMIDPDGVVRRLSGTMQDISDRRRIDQHLAQSQKMEAIGNLTGGMAHDFNNGLGVIIGNLDLLGRLIKANPIAVELCTDARDGALRCADLIHLLLAFARQQPLKTQKTDVNTLVAQTSKLLSRTLGEDLVLTLHLDPALRLVMVDPSQLEAALTNLANNARDAMPRGGKLDIATKMAELDTHYAEVHLDALPGAYVLIEVSDTGVGIAPEIIDKVFDPFFTTKGSGRGTGLGLSMVYGFTMQSGGHLTVYSEPGLGSVFRMYLPPAPVGDVEPVVAVDRQPAVGGDETVLVVEDNAPLRQSVARQLGELGYRVLEAECAESALAVLTRGDRVDILFTDIVMPGTMDGLDLANRATELRQGLKVLLTSGFPGVRSANQGTIAFPFRMLSKPYGYADLARTMREVLDSR
jgi:signal transduction histidine kinase/CheY-like chemotaxis protein